MKKAINGQPDKLVSFARPYAYILDKARENRKKGRYLAALDLFRAAYRAIPLSGTLVEMAETLIDMGSYRLAVTNISKALAANSRKTEALYPLAVCFYALDKTVLAYDAADLYLRYHPDGPYASLAWEIIARTHEDTRYAHMRRAAGLMNLAETDLKNGYLYRAVKRLYRAVALPGTDAKLISAAATLLYRRGAYLEGIRLTLQAFKYYRDSAVLLCTAAMGYFINSKPRAARAVLTGLTRCARNASDDDYIFYVLMALKAYEQGLRWFQNAAAEACYDPHVLGYLALFNLMLGQSGDAERLCHRSLAFDPADKENRYILRLIKSNASFSPNDDRPAILNNGNGEKTRNFAAAHIPGGVTGIRRIRSAARFGPRQARRLLSYVMSNATVNAGRRRLKEWLLDEDMPEWVKKSAFMELKLIYPNIRQWILIYGRLFHTKTLPMNGASIPGRTAFIKQFLFFTAQADNPNRAASFAADFYDAINIGKMRLRTQHAVDDFFNLLALFFYKSCGRPDLIDTHWEKTWLSRRRSRGIVRLMNGMIGRMKD